MSGAAVHLLLPEGMADREPGRGVITASGPGPAEHLRLYGRAPHS